MTRKLDPTLDILDPVPGYESLQLVLKLAYEQAAHEHSARHQCERRSVGFGIGDDEHHRTV